MYLPQDDPVRGKLSQVKEEEEEDVLFEPQPGMGHTGSEDVMSGVVTNEGAISEGGVTSDGPFSEAFSEGLLSEEPFSDGPLAEEPLSEEPVAEDPLPDGQGVDPAGGRMPEEQDE
jgi:hypothetical protein